MFALFLLIVEKALILVAGLVIITIICAGPSHGGGSIKGKKFLTRPTPPDTKHLPKRRGNGGNSTETRA